MDVYYWQCQGVTKWIVEDKEVVLNPGDLIYVPKWYVSLGVTIRSA